MAIAVMNRVENKYLVDTPTYLKLLKIIENNAELDKYNKNQDFYTISNLYLDTDDNYLIRTSISKPKYKEKIRLRAYGIPTELDKVYLEIKKKYCGTVNKRRTAFNLSDAYEFIGTHFIPEKAQSNLQISKELAFALKRYQPVPKVYIAYDRKAYIGDNGLRITFDSNIRTRRYDLRLEYGDYGDLILEKDKWIIETKAKGALPLWLVRAFSENKVYSAGFSKYGTEYKQFLVKGGMEQCLNQFSIRQPIPQPLPSHGRAQLPQLA